MIQLTSNFSHPCLRNIDPAGRSPGTRILPCLPDDDPMPSCAQTLHLLPHPPPNAGRRQGKRKDALPADDDNPGVMTPVFKESVFLERFRVLDANGTAGSVRKLASDFKSASKAGCSRSFQNIDRFWV